MAYINFWRRWKDFLGKTSRAEYWMALFTHVFLSFILMMAILVFLTDVVGFQPEEKPHCFEIIWSLYGISWLVPFLAMSVRRIRDAGYNKSNAWKLLIPGVLVLALILPSIDEMDHKSY